MCSSDLLSPASLCVEGRRHVSPCRAPRPRRHVRDRWRAAYTRPDRSRPISWPPWRGPTPPPLLSLYTRARALTDLVAIMKSSDPARTMERPRSAVSCCRAVKQAIIYMVNPRGWSEGGASGREGGRRVGVRGCGGRRRTGGGQGCEAPRGSRVRDVRDGG